MFFQMSIFGLRSCSNNLLRVCRSKSATSSSTSSSLSSSPAQLSSWRWKSSNPVATNAMQEQYAFEVNPVDTKYLKETKIEKSKNAKSSSDVTMWDHIQTYRSGSYHEKTFLIDPKVSETIVDAIEKHSDRGPDTKFVDADGGLCLVTKEVMKRDLFKAADGHLVFEKDSNFQVVNRRAAENYLSKDCKLRKISLVNSVMEFQKNWGQYIDPLYREMSVYPATNWDDPCPNYTLFGTVTHGLIKYLTTRCLFRNESQFGEFRLGRPEFFLVVSPRTWTHLSVESESHILHRNILFGIVFDFECVAELPREAFLPWKKSPGKVSNSLSRRYHDLEGMFFLIKVRPKKDLGLVEGTPIHFLSYFVQSLYIKNSNQRIIPTIERWLPGAGLDFIRHTNYTVYTTSREIAASEIVPMLNLLTKQKNFNNVNNNFVIQANTYAHSQFKDGELKTDEAKQCYANLKRDLKLPAEKGASGKKQNHNNNNSFRP